MHQRHAPAPHGTAPARRERLAVTPQRVRHQRPGRRVRVARCASRQQQQPGRSTGSNVLVQGLVAAATETLRLLGVGRQEYQAIAAQPSQTPPPAPGDVASLSTRLTRDFERLYFVTGVIDDGIYDTQCTFADPTVKFSGLDLWKRNLQLLVPFLIQPEIQLLSLECLQRPDSGAAQQLQAGWTLRTTLALPWRPLISIVGRTLYTLNAEANQIEDHTEFWDVSAVQALLQILTPGKGKQ